MKFSYEIVLELVKLFLSFCQKMCKRKNMHDVYFMKVKHLNDFKFTFQKCVCVFV